MSYTDIYQLKGLNEPADYGSGIEYAKGLAEAFPESGLQIGLWLNGDQGCRDIVSGLLDDNVYRLFDFIQSYLPQSLPKVFLRVGYEFDNPSFGYSNPSLYQNAFRKLVRSCEHQLNTTVCHEKIAFVWHSWAAPRQINTSLNQFYPGSDFVDWVGVSIFQQLYPWANKGNEHISSKDGEGDFAGGDIFEVKEILDFAKSKDKPIMIAESTPFGGMFSTGSNIEKGYIEKGYLDGNSTSDVWNLWFQKTIDLINEYDIAMWSYINCDWDSQPMWKGIGFGDTRLSSSNDVMNHWWDQILNNNHNNNNNSSNDGNSTSRFLFHIENCNDGESSYEHIAVVGAAEGKKNNGNGSITQGILSTSVLLSKSVVSIDMSNNSWRMQLSYFLCVGGIVVLLLLRLMRHKTNQRCHQLVEVSSYQRPHSNYSERTYGSFEMKTSNSTQSQSFAL
mmetsp:Transcript_51056/g.52011  ORF Transcript_51056/g.52011 Transcript_51056/m.52011 type:complete len:447 (+) Transcript_51056:148-1488(+)